jgi:alginate O-acetyltransferase complex protein AlgJ
MNYQGLLSKYLTFLFVLLSHSASASDKIIDPDKLETKSWIQLENEIEERNYQSIKPYYDLSPGTETKTKNAVMGLNGYTFVFEGSNSWEKQLLQNDFFPADFYHKWVSLIHSRHNQAGQLGIKLVQIVVPDKQAIIPHLRWKNIPETISQRPILKLLAHLGQDGLYPIQPLLEQARNGCLYPRHECHWNALACWLYFKPLMEKTWPDHKFSHKELTVSVTSESGVLLNSFWDNKVPHTQEKTRFIPIGKKVYTNNIFPKELLNHCETWFNPDAKIKQKLLIFGGSSVYGYALPMLTSFIENVTFYWGGDISWNVVKILQPDVVLWQLVERFLNKVPKDTRSPDPLEAALRLNEPNNFWQTGIVSPKVQVIPDSFDVDDVYFVHTDLDKYLKDLNTEDAKRNWAIDHGVNEHRCTSLPRDFDAIAYVRMHPDLLKEATRLKMDLATYGRGHYIIFGFKERRPYR